jgi:hypothetical protein
MANPIIFIGIGAAALLLLGGKKKTRTASLDSSKATPYEPGDIPPKPPEAPKSGPSNGEASKQIWIGRQKAMKYLSDMKVCNSDPGTIDGRLGEATRDAVGGLQICLGIFPPDRKWSKQIDNLLPVALARAFEKAMEEVARG